MDNAGKTDAEQVADAGLNLSERSSGNGSPEFHVSGETHAVRHALRRAGGTWDKLKRVWIFTGDDPTPAIASALSAEPPPPGGLSESDGPNGNEKPHYWGHRQRLRDRFMAQGSNGLADYELLELLLFFSIPRVDVKPLAKTLIEKFGSFAGVLAAEPDRLAEIDDLTYQSVVQLKAVQAAGLNMARAEFAEQPVLKSWSKLLQYLKAHMGHETKEQFRIVFLNTKNAVTADEVQQHGTVNHTPVYPREVIKRALDLGATALIMVHNHPSGDPTPSQADIDMTTEVMEAGERLGIMLHDNIIISKHGHSSFK